MHFAPTPEQDLFADTLDALLGTDEPGAAARAWARGDRGPGERQWRGLAEAGLFSLAVPEEHGGAGPLPVELALGMIEAGRHAVPGALVETAAAALLLDDDALLERIATGRLAVSVAVPPWAPHALDADRAGAVLVVADGRPHTADPVERLASLDPARRLWRVRRGAPVPAGPLAGCALDLAVLCCAAQALGVGQRLLESTVDHVRTRRQFGRPISDFQAVRHRLADTATALHFARPLVLGAAAAFDFGPAHGKHGSSAADGAHGATGVCGSTGTHGTTRARDVSAAKAAACDAAHTAARTALQLHGAIGYTDEHPATLWIRKAHTLRRAWGTPTAHRTRVLEALDRADRDRDERPDDGPGTGTERGTTGSATVQASDSRTPPTERP
ncbi:acyl-CoA dehydrogenase family protein [Nocardiopsis halophila]|uniref:acyl-CoA dehydrogenase family protein n=1 Tax=Nocardiopsis halophila TaxID=141692 RepID=UPI00034BDF03|nr:acyl-CoA dehydrogenase family protein [Nocardiopsis halophila]